MRSELFSLALGTLIGAMVVAIGTTIDAGDSAARLAACLSLIAVVLVCAIGPARRQP